MDFIRKNAFLLLNGIIVFVMLFCVFAVGRFESGDASTAGKGVLDLSDTVLRTDSIVTLNGEWEFYWNQLLEPEDFSGSTGIKPELTGYIKVPHVWTTGLEGKKLPARGYATYRLKVRLGETDRILGLKTVNIRMASRAYVNGRAVLGSGMPASEPDLSSPGNTPQTAFFDVEGKDLEIIVQVDNHVYRNGGIIQSIYLGGQKAIVKKVYTSTALDVIVFSSLVMIACIHIITYLAAFIRKRKEPILLTFSMICLALAIGSTGLGEKTMFQLFPWIPTEAGYKATDFCIQLCSVLEGIFLLQIGEGIAPKRFIKAAIALFGGYLLVIALVPLSVYSVYHHLYFLLSVIFNICVLYFLLSAWKKKKEGTIGRNNMIILAVGFAYSLILSMDFTLYVNSMKETYVIGAISILLFVLMLSAILANRFSEAFSEIQSMSRELLTLDKLKDEFLANTSHELQTPINGIINISQSVMEGASGSTNRHQQENLHMIVEIAKRLSILINDILDMSKLKSNEIKLILTPVDVKANVNAVSEIFRHMITEKEIALQNLLPDDLPAAYADENRLHQVLYNLIGNAIKFTVKGEITVSGRMEGRQLRISVADTGIGIPPDKFEIIFRSFEQVEGSETRERGGTGLGLSISRRLVELMGGTLELVWSELGKGSRFDFTLPASTLPAPGEAPSCQPGTRGGPIVPRISRPELIKGGRHRVLVVDDEISNLYVLINMLAHEDCDILTASDGQSALACIEGNNRIDLVVLDVMMPRMSGFEVCRRIRERYSLLTLPVLLVTARSTPEDVAVGFEAGANDFVTKPFAAAAVRARIRTLLKLKGTMEEAVRSEMAFLQSQIKPHFLYNALNSISSLCLSDGEKASELIDQLGIYLRKTFRDAGKASLIPLQSELELVSVYLYIEKVRFGDRLAVEYDIDEEADGLIPPLVLQPLVENAVRHGLMKKVDGGTVRIKVVKEKERLLFNIEDNGVGMTQALQNSLLEEKGGEKGVGLTNINRRLVNMFGQGLSIDSTPGKGTAIFFAIPVKHSGEEETS